MALSSYLSNAITFTVKAFRVLEGLSDKMLGLGLRLLYQVSVISVSVSVSRSVTAPDHDVIVQSPAGGQMANGE